MSKYRRPNGDELDDLLWHTSREIILNVYDIHESNSWLFPAGLGFFHSGIEVVVDNEPLGYEYSFSTEGIIKTRPRLPGFGRLRDQIKLGTHVGTVLDIHRVVNNLGRDKFAVGKYDIICCNCNHFSEAFATALLESSIPGWINRMASIGSLFYSPNKDIVEETKHGGNMKNSTPTQSDEDHNYNCAWLCGITLPTIAPEESKKEIPLVPVNSAKRKNLKKEKEIR